MLGRRKNDRSAQGGPRKRGWVQNVDVRSDVLEAQLEALEARGFMHVRKAERASRAVVLRL